MARCLLLLLLLASTSIAAERPGNVHVLGERIHVGVPAGWTGWRAVDIDGNEVAHGDGSNVAELGELPVGYYEVLETGGSGRKSAAVLAKANASAETPIAIDTAISWFYSDPQQIADACALCRLAGVTWIRDRLSWPELETARGAWSGETRYERAMRIEREAGLKILQVNHISPPWATEKPSRFPEDLSDVYNFYRGLAERWHGKVDAIEPWNEPDIEVFGGHTGCEIASFQKAAYLGLKAGNPELPVCQAVFAIDRAETLREFAANEVHPYFEIYNLHHYTALTAYPRVYGRHRAVSGGRPLWTTEFNLTVNWADEKTHEPSQEDLRVQAFRVAKVFATALHEGVEKAFYFILGHYVERNLQYGLVRPDLTPRPAFVAFAAVCRLLNEAKPLGAIDLGDEKLKGYAFSTVVDRLPRETVVAWSETKPTRITFNEPQKAYDYLGRELKAADAVELTRAPVFFILSPGTTKKLKVTVPPAKPQLTAGKPCHVVLQLIGSGDVNQSGFRIDEGGHLRLIAYNFSDKVVRGTPVSEGIIEGLRALQLNPGEKVELSIRPAPLPHIIIRMRLEKGEEAVVAARLLHDTVARD